MVVLMPASTLSRLLGLGVLAALLTQGDSLVAQRRIVKISAERFSFTPSEIAMTTGEEIEIRLKSDDTSHGFRLVGRDVDLTIPKRGQGEVSVVFKPEQAGRYEFECSHLCGAGHSFMRGVIVVKDPKPVSGPIGAGR
jgi:cytochrome c oxidase subunit 2